MSDELEQPTMEEIYRLRKMIREEFAAEPDDEEVGYDLRTSIDADPRFSRETDTSSLDALRRWVDAVREDCQSKGTWFSSALRCVSEGGEIIYLDPECIVDLMDVNLALHANIRELHQKGGT